MPGKMKKGALVKAIKDKLNDSVEAYASDNRFPDYLFQTKGEIVEIEGEYALVKFYVPTPNIWLNLNLLELTD